jgi:hypothetical protein
MTPTDARIIVKQLVDAVLETDDDQQEGKKKSKNYLDPFDPRYPDSAARFASLKGKDMKRKNSVANIRSKKWTKGGSN